jgi:hypothetical protein
MRLHLLNLPFFVPHLHFLLPFLLVFLDDNSSANKTDKLPETCDDDVFEKVLLLLPFKMRRRLVIRDSNGLSHPLHCAQPQPPNPVLRCISHVAASSRIDNIHVRDSVGKV